MNHLNHANILAYAQQLSRQLNIPLPIEQDVLTLSLWISENDQSHIKNSSAYLQSWIKTLQDDKKSYQKSLKLQKI